MLNGLLDLSGWGVLLYTLVLTHITIVAVTVFLHRHQAHRALEMHPLVSHFFRFWLWLTTGMITREWVAVHRKHHAKCETADDPHSPQVKGLKAVLLRGAELYRVGASDEAGLARYGKGTPQDWIERNLYGRYNLLGIALMLVANVVLLGPIGLTVWAIQMIWIPIWAAGVINGVGHYLGYRNFASPDASTNIVPWGILIGGEELHNNHHTYSNSAKLSAKPWEFDIGWMYIRLLEGMGLARVNRVAPKPVRLDAGTAPLDAEALRTLASHRFQVLARYSRQVMKRVYREEIRRAGDRSVKLLLKRVKGYLWRDERLLDETARQRLERAMARSETVRTVHEYRQRLQAVWQQAAQSQEKGVAALQQWGREAEASGIRALEEFARGLGAVRVRSA